jgi:signal transduction histidine kinase
MNNFFSGESELSGIQRSIIEEMLFENMTPQGRSKKIEILQRFIRGIAGYSNDFFVDAGDGISLSAGMPVHDVGSRDQLVDMVRAKQEVARFIGMAESLSSNRNTEYTAIALDDFVNREETLRIAPFAGHIEYVTEPSGKGAVFFGHQGLMGQALKNIIVNGMEAMPRGGRLTVSTSLVPFNAEFTKTYGVGERLLCGVISVSDTGVGVNDHIKEKIFEPFFTTKEKRLGLGLTISNEILRFYNGCIRFSSQEQLGTVVELYLPAYEVRPGAATDRLSNLP